MPDLSPSQPGARPNALEIHDGITLKGQLSMVKDVVLTGKFEGELHTLGCLTVPAGGVAIGTIEAGALVLEPGNQVEARVKITPPGFARKPGASSPGGAGNKWPSKWKKKLKELTLGRV